MSSNMSRNIMLVLTKCLISECYEYYCLQGFVLRSGGTLTEHVVAHSNPFPLFPFPPGSLYDRKKWSQLELIIAYKMSFVPTYVFNEVM